MNLPTIVALTVIGAAALFVVFVQIRARGLARGVMPEWVFMPKGKTCYPAIWSVSAEIECNGYIISAGSVFEAVE
jgi:hypothetical protein